MDSNVQYSRRMSCFVRAPFGKPGFFECRIPNAFANPVDNKGHIECIGKDRACRLIMLCL